MMSFLGLLLYTICIFLRPGEWIASLGRAQYIIGALTTAFFVFEILIAKKPLVKAPQNKFIMLLFFTLICSHILHFYFNGALRVVIDMGKNLILYFFVANIIYSKKRLNIYLGLLVLLTVTLALQGIIQFRYGSGLGGMSAFGQESRIRGLGVFNDPNDLALVFVVILPFVISSFLSRKFKIISLTFLVIISYALFLTKSRGGFLALAVSIFFYFMRKSKRSLLGFVVASILVLLVFILGPSRLSNLSPADASAYGRVEAWYMGIQMMLTSPVWGIGYGMFTSDYTITAHNSYMLILAEGGILGLLFWIGLFYFSFITLKPVAKDNGMQAYGLNLQTSIIGFCVGSFFLSRTYIFLPYILFALAAAAGSIYSRNKDLPIRSITRKDLFRISVITFATIIAIYVLIKISL